MECVDHGYCSWVRPEFMASAFADERRCHASNDPLGPRNAPHKS